MNKSLTTLAAATLIALCNNSVEAGNPTAHFDVIVKLKPEYAVNGHQENRRNAQNIAAGLGVGSVKHSYGTAFFGFSATISEQRLTILRRHPKVAAVMFDEVKTVNKGKPGGGSGAPDPQQTPWGIERIGATRNNNEGAGVHVYVLDTGIDSDHGDLSVTSGMAFESCKGPSCNTPWDDDHGHGTHVAGTIAALDNQQDVIGVASQVTLHAAKICTSRGSCPNSSTIAALDWVTAEVSQRQEAAVVNMSIGGSGSVTGSCTNAGLVGNDAYHEAICNARNAGVVVVVAAGNSGADAENYTPAGYSDTVITVSSVREGDDWNSFSNWGDGAATWTNNLSAPITIAAPGGNILSLRAGGGTTTMSGTSMASPHVAGAVALFLASTPQPANGTAFINARNALLQRAESTDGFNNTTGDPHFEDFLNVDTL
ncbi:MAG: S8 family serine peptidase [Gammaproteobacteria bacterium]|nr:S8 family serine peptidase [Gammaproteobacteria bacterium]